LEGDLIAEGLELGDGPLAGTLAVTPDEEVAAKVVVVAVAIQQVSADHQDGVAHGDRGLLLADAPGQPSELGSQVGVAASGSGPGARGQLS
jgi:hypothetical protein